MSLILIKNIKTLLQARDISYAAGQKMRDIGALDDAFLLIEGEKIADFGAMADLPQALAKLNLTEKALTEIDATGRVVSPCFADSHTHIVYAGSRENEFVDKIKGLSYEEIAKRGGGILNSAKRLQAATEDELYQAALGRVKEMVGYGIGAIEIKSGYGLTVADELKMLRVVKRLKQNTPVTIKSTLLAAHALPESYRNRREDFISLIINEMIPQAVAEGLADYCDVFCDKGFFTVEETAQILEAGARYGLKPKIHANELDFSGGIQVGVAHKAISVDHLECTGDEEIEVLMESHTMPTLLPSTAFFLRIPYPPARQMIDSGLPVAVATDYNPGSSPSGNMLFVLSLACLYLKMLPEEALNAATINGARALELESSLGSISKGKIANIFITNPISSYTFIPYSFGQGGQLIDTVILRGQIVKKSGVVSF
ncbi:imidazolonepropionase [Flexibacter flexilis DSM 6793]|uniref:Imidazolonepropionase n=1 Tax=Flexibacter flexilis DSM 6793 TaxID=927664 RepID=A0A1I1HYL7_9BACT|nr:imidazolonepropionase [Flexibacter flexilis]SFC29279.1 imidazolonepropionase [Flexibacter flexilis DSM 6793]